MNRQPDIPIYLERLDPARRMARFYAIGIEPTLFGDWAVVCRWGRIGTFGQRREHWFTRRAAALEAAHAVRVRKQRRGYRRPAARDIAPDPAAVDAARLS